MHETVHFKVTSQEMEVTVIGFLLTSRVICSNGSNVLYVVSSRTF